MPPPPTPVPALRITGTGLATPTGNATGPSPAPVNSGSGGVDYSFTTFLHHAYPQLGPMVGIHITSDGGGVALLFHRSPMAFGRAGLQFAFTVDWGPRRKARMHPDAHTIHH